jgi:hypothetical protein
MTLANVPREVRYCVDPAEELIHNKTTGESIGALYEGARFSRVMGTRLIWVWPPNSAQTSSFVVLLTMKTQQHSFLSILLTYSAIRTPASLERYVYVCLLAHIWAHVV